VGGTYGGGEGGRGGSITVLTYVAPKDATGYGGGGGGVGNNDGGTKSGDGYKGVVLMLINNSDFI